MPVDLKEYATAVLMMRQAQVDFFTARMRKDGKRASEALQRSKDEEAKVDKMTREILGIRDPQATLF